MAKEVQQGTNIADLRPEVGDEIRVISRDGSIMEGKFYGYGYLFETGGVNKLKLVETINPETNEYKIHYLEIRDIVDIELNIKIVLP